jgi:hypothetical protein
LEKPLGISTFRSEDYEIGKSEDTAEDFDERKFNPAASKRDLDQNIQMPATTAKTQKQGYNNNRYTRNHPDFKIDSSWK